MDYDAAVALADRAHKGQTDKGGAPYIAHPIRVSLRVTGEQEQIAAVLHDVVEDTPVTLDQIRRQFGATIADAVDALTKRRGEDYSDFILRCRKNPIARRVKIEDLHDNMDTSRLPKPLTEADEHRQLKYMRALTQLS
jgi:(p)ppGpp synthase/HD superfamily hydrolase